MYIIRTGRSWPFGLRIIPSPDCLGALAGAPQCRTYVDFNKSLFLQFPCQFQDVTLPHVEFKKYPMYYVVSLLSLEITIGRSYIYLFSKLSCCRVEFKVQELVSVQCAVKWKLGLA